jgi:hypothetical protein
MLPISRFGRYGPLGPDDPDNSQPFISALRLLQEQGGLAPVQPGNVRNSSAFPSESDASTPPPPSPSVVIGWAPTPSQRNSPTPSNLTEVPLEELEALRALVPSPTQEAFRITDAELQEILAAIPNLPQEEAAAMFRALEGIPMDRIQPHFLESVRTSVYGVVSSSDGGSHTPVQAPMEIDPSPGHLDNPIVLSDSSQETRAIDTRIASSFAATPVLPISDALISAQAYPTGTREHVASLLTEGGDYSQLAPFDLQQEAVDAMIGATDELNQAVEGYSHYFLEQPLHMLASPTFAVESVPLRRMVDVVTAVVSMGAHDELDVEHGEAWRSLMPGSWYRLSFSLLSAILRGCIRTPRIAHHGRFDFLPCLDTFRFSAQLPMPGTQRDALRFMAQQLLDHIDGPHGGPLLPHAAAMTVRDAAWQAQRELIREEVRRIVNPIRERISAMALSDIIDQLEAGDSVTEITHSLQLELEEEARRKFADRLQNIKADTTARLKREAEAEAEDEARILQEEWRFKFLDELRDKAHAKAWTEQLAYWTDLFAGRDDVKEKAKRAAKRAGDREYYDTLEDCRVNNKTIADKELSTEIADYKDQRRAALMLRADQEIAGEERELVRQAAVKLGLMHPLEQGPSQPVPKRTRNEPRSQTAALALQDARSRSASLSTVRKRGRSASLDTPRQSSFKAHPEPSPCLVAGDDDTPMNSPSESLTGSQIAQVKQELVENDPLRGLRSSSHCPDNAMTDDSPSPPSPPKPDWPSAAHSRHATPAPDFARLPSHFTPAPDFSPDTVPFTARIGGNDEVDGPAPSDRTPTAEPDPAMAAAHHITNAVRHEVEQRLNPIVLQLNSLTGLMQRLSDKVFATPAVVSKTAPPPATPNLAPPQNPSHSTLPVRQSAPVPRAPVTLSPDVVDTVTAPAHNTVTDAMSEVPDSVNFPEPVDAVMFPSLEETRLAIPSRRVKRNAENKAAREKQRSSVPGATGPTPTPLPTPHGARVDDDDGHIPLRTSRVRPMFASVATQKTVNAHQAATTSGNQARAVQGRSATGKAKTVIPAEESVTHATVIRHGGLPSTEAERALHAKPAHFLVQAAQRALDRLSRQPLKILHGSWSQNYEQTRNFSYVLSGLIPARELLKYKTQLCEPFKGSETDLVPARGWSWAQLRNVPTVDEEGLVWSPEDLFHSFIANPCFSDALICAPPHWQGNPVFSGKDASTVLVAYIDDGNLISQRATKEGVYMFGRQVAFIHCGDSPTLVQCSRCHMLGHYATSTRCKAPVNSIKCFRCGAAHDGRKHDYECTRNHKVPGRCDCVLKCLLCGAKDHHCRSQKCPKRGPGPSGIAKLPTHPGTDESRSRDKAIAPANRLPQLPKTSSVKKSSRVPYTNRDAVMAVPAGVCANDPEKNNILCECCAPPSIVDFINRYLGAPETTNDTRTRSYPRARPISSKGKGLVDIHREISARKKYGTATLREKSAELDIALHDDDEIEQLLGEGETATMESKLTPEELDYGAPRQQLWGLEEAGLSTGWDCTEDTATVIAIHPDAHLVCDTAEIADKRRQTFQRSDDMNWTQRGHPNMIIRAAPGSPVAATNPFNVLAERHD